MPEKPPKRESLDDGWDLPDESAATPKEEEAPTSGRDARPGGQTSGSPTRGGALSYEELRAAGVAMAPPAPAAEPKPVRGGARSWADLVSEPPDSPAAKPPAGKAAAKPSAAKPSATKPAPKAPPVKPIRGGTRPFDELRAAAPPLPPVAPSKSPVRGGTKSWDEERPIVRQPVPRLGQPSPTRRGTRSIDELHPRGGADNSLDDLPVEGLLEKIAERQDSAPDIEIVGEVALDIPLDEEDDVDPPPKPRSK